MSRKNNLCLSFDLFILFFTSMSELSTVWADSFGAVSHIRAPRIPIIFCADRSFSLEIEPLNHLQDLCLKPCEGKQVISAIFVHDLSTLSSQFSLL